MPFYSPMVEHALRHAARCHAGQKRKGSDVPYLTHLAGVALILARAGFDDDETLAAALLHDAVEDTDCTLAGIAAEFPPAVAEYVAALTERKADAQGQKRPWIDRKTEHLAQVAVAPQAARAIVLADKLHNLASILLDLEQSPATVWGRFNASRDQVLWYHEAMIDAAAGNDAALRPLADAARELVARLRAIPPTV